jgi:hypothetical protein
VVVFQPRRRFRQHLVISGGGQYPQLCNSGSDSHNGLITRRPHTNTYDLT